MITDAMVRGAYHISNNARQYNPQRRNNFVLIVKGLENILRPGAEYGSTADNDIIANGQLELLLGLKSCTVPTVSTDPVNISRGNSIIKFAGKPTISNMEIVAYDYIGSDVKDTLYAWQNAYYNQTYDIIGGAAQYKKDCVLYEYAPDMTTVVRYWDIKGAWPTVVTPDGFDYESGDAATISATLAIDWFLLHLPNEA